MIRISVIIIIARCYCKLINLQSISIKNLTYGDLMVYIQHSCGYLHILKGGVALGESGPDNLVLSPKLSKRDIIQPQKHGRKWA